MRRAVDALIDGARRSVMLADGFPTAHAARDLIDADMLAPPTLALRLAIRAQPPLPVRRRHRRERRVLVADRPAADRASDDALAARGMVTLCARRFMRGAVRLVTGDAGARML